MEHFDFDHEKISIWCNEISGTVLSSQKHSETYVSSSGGGGYVHNGTGSVNAPTIRSQTILKHEFWLRREADNQEIPVKLSGVDVPLREGQKISLIMAGRKGTETGWYTTLVNRSASQHWFLINGKEFGRNVGIKGFHWGYSLIGVIVIWFFVPFSLLDPIGSFLKVVAVVMFLLFAFTKQRKAERFARAFDGHLERVAQSIYKA